MKTSLILSTLFLALMGSIFAGVLGVNPMIGAAVMQVVQFMPMPAGVLGMSLLTAKVLEEQRTAIHEEMVALNKVAKDENRKFKDDEKTKWNELQTKYDGFDDQILEAKEREALEEREARRKIAETQREKEVKTIKKYSFLEACRAISSGQKATGFIAEMDQEARKQAITEGITLLPHSLVIPRMILNPNAEKRDMTAGTATEGGNAVATVLEDFIEFLYARLVLTDLGADFMTGLIGNIDFPTESAVATATWEGETDANAESDPTVGKISMSPKRLGTYTDISNQLLIQTSPSIEARIRRQFVNAIQLAIEAAAINGTGVDPIPEGILNTTGIGDVAGGTDGAAPTWANIVTLESLVAAANADVGNLGYLINAVTRGKLKTTPKVATNDLFIFGDGAMPLNGYKAAVTNQVPSNLVKGSSGAVCSAIIFGNFADLIIGMWGGMEILADPYTQATSGLFRLVVNTFADVAVGHPASFAAMQDALTV